MKIQSVERAPSQYGWAEAYVVTLWRDDWNKAGSKSHDKLTSQCLHSLETGYIWKITGRDNLSKQLHIYIDGRYAAPPIRGERVELCDHP